MNKIFVIFSAIICLSSSLANAADWKIIQNQSKIEFKAIQNSSTITGSFKNFSGKINFDPAQLKTSKIEIEIDIASLEASLSDAVSTLKTPEWLSTKNFPKAIFNAEKFSKISDKKFIAEGNLTIKGKTIPTKLEFTLEEYTATKAKSIGTATIKRSDFLIGAKDPANAHGVKDEVTVSCLINATK